MEILVDNNNADLSKFFDLIKLELPDELRMLSDMDLLQEINKSFDSETDKIKYLNHDSNIIGWYRYSKWPRNEKDTKTVHALDIAIAKEYQGKGFGVLLFNDMIMECKLTGINKIISRTIKSNEQSYGLHKRIGFKELFVKNDSIIWEIEI